MVPALSNGDFIVNIETKIGTTTGRYNIGDIVVVRHHKLGDIVKRVIDVSADNYLRLAGDSPLSTSSEVLGWQPVNSVLGKVIWRVPFRIK